MENIKESLQEFVEMLESDLELTKEIGDIYDERRGNVLSHNEIMQNYINDLKNIINN